MQEERGEVVFAGAAARRFQVVPDRPGRGLHAVEEVRVAVQRLPFGKFARGEFAQKFDIISKARRARASRVLPRPVQRGGVRRRSPRASRGLRAALARRRLASSGNGLHEVVPEDERVSVAAVGAGWQQVARLYDRGTRASRVPGDVEFPFDIVRIDAAGAARYACDDWRRPQVYEHVPRFAQHSGLSQRTP